MQVKDVMVQELESISPDDTLRDASEKMKALDLEPLPVCEHGKLVGMLTEADIRDHAAKVGLAAGSRLVREAMSSEVVACYEDQDIGEAAAIQGSHPRTKSCRGVLVLDRNDRLVGIVAMRALQDHEPERPSLTSGVGASEPKVSYQDDPVDHMSQESFPASDPPPPPSHVSRVETDGERS